MQLPQIFHTGVRLHNTRLNHKGNRGLGGDVKMRTCRYEKILLCPSHQWRWARGFGNLYSLWKPESCDCG